MLRYETLFLTVPEITLDEVSAIESNLQKLFKEHVATFVSFERWGKMLLAYPVRKNDYGVYFLIRFEVDQAKAPALLDAVRLFFAVKLNETVMRHLVNKLDVKGAWEYQRPDSLEDAPTRPAESFRDSRDNDHRGSSQDMNNHHLAD